MRGLLQKSKERAARIKKQPDFLEPKVEAKDHHEPEVEKERDKITSIMT